MTLRTDDFYYELPAERIAQTPMSPRDHSRLLAADVKNKTTADRRMTDFPDYIRSGDLIVWNNSKVFKARLFGRLVSQNGQSLLDHTREAEIFLVRPMENLGVWQVLAKPGRHIRNGMRVQFAPDFFCDVMVKEPAGTILVQFPDTADIVRAKANRYGHIPVPPYVKDEPHELESYQTVYAAEEGSVAAPTAGFHFTDALIAQLKEKGAEFAEVTLHVGLGTFLPVKTERVDDHTMHSEWAEITEENAAKINHAKREGRRVVCIGTTTTRTLEGVAALAGSGGQVRAFCGDINIFIKPGFSFRIADALLTNFHLPKSTLLMLVAAFAGDREFILRCYEHAVREQYRFYSFGDAMFLY
jgi:S-adenosylmethionine:tRNA ribosyltransferase-isomerase